MYINIHSHLPPVKNEWTLQSFYNGFEHTPKDLPFSAGLHPWYLQENLEEQFRLLQASASRGNCLAIGECGLDKVCTTDLALQSTAFERQVTLANKLNKPLIIHCVRAYDELLSILKQKENRVPVVFHGFNKSAELAHQLVSREFYLSFGRDIAKNHVQAYLPTLPIGQICFETDDEDIPVEAIYRQAATAMEIELDDLALQIQKNVKKILGIQL